MRKQFAKLGIELVIRSTDYNRFQDKMRKGTAQIFMWGWNADYPDPENFLFLLYGPNGKVKADGENAANYANAEFDTLFEQMRNMDNGPERQAVIDRMLAIARRDAPWIWGFYAVSYTLHHAWLYNAVPNLMANNTLKYRRVDPVAREAARRAWNGPVLWPLLGIGLALILGALPAVWTYRGASGVVPCDCLYRSPAPLRRPHPHLGQSPDLPFVFRGQLPRRHRPDAARAEAGRRRGDPELEGRRRLRPPPALRPGGAGPRQGDAAVFFQKSVKLFAFNSGYSDDGRDIGYNISRRIHHLAIAVQVLLVGLAVNIRLMPCSSSFFAPPMSTSAASYSWWP